MKTNWLIEQNVFDGDADLLVKHVGDSGNNVHLVNFGPISFDSPIFPFKADEDTLRQIKEYSFQEPWITYGSIHLCKVVNNRTRLLPGIFCNFSEYYCSQYYNYFGQFLINKDYIMLPLKEIKRSRKNLQRHFGDIVFIRPDAGDKPFSAGTISLASNFDQEFEYVLQNNNRPNGITIIAEQKTLTKEFRLLVVNKQVVTGSLYKEHSKIKYERIDHSNEAWQYAQSIIDDINWQPDPVYTIDVGYCLQQNKPGIIEINSFSSAGLYDCDPEIVVNLVNDVVKTEFNK